MFKKLWNAIGRLAESFETLANSVNEANENFRENMGLDYRPDVPELEHEGNGKPKARKAVK